MVAKQQLSNKLAKLPKTPGVYFYKDASRKIIYVGKASVLRNRVRQYFQSPARLDNKTQVLVSEIVGLDWVETESEIDALFLESEMIKRYLPKYNILLRDDKHYLYIRIDIKSEHPTVQFVRRPMDDGASYFGPYMSAFEIRKAMRFLRRIFPYDLKPPAGKRVSLHYHLGLSPGLEEGKTSLSEYRQNLRKLMMFLKAQRSLLIKQLEKEMLRAAKAEDFELAAQRRNQINALKAFKRQMVFGDKEKFDVTKDQALNGLVELLDLKGNPRRIEAYDISHLHGSSNTASMVVFTEGVADKSQYRKFKMRTPGNDDFAHMREVITRRFSEANAARWPKPDLLIIDGGKGQLSSARAVMAEKGISIPAIGLAKREETIIRAVEDRFEEIKLPTESHVLMLLQRIRDEAHRFAVTYHSLLHSKRQTLSTLDEIPGIGPSTRKKLIKHFGSLRAVGKASTKELEKILGKKKALALKQHLHSYQ